MTNMLMMQLWIDKICLLLLLRRGRTRRLWVREADIHQPEELIQSVLLLLLHHLVLHVDEGSQNIEPDDQDGDYQPCDDHCIVPLCA